MPRTMRTPSKRTSGWWWPIAAALALAASACSVGGDSQAVGPGFETDRAGEADAADGPDGEVAGPSPTTAGSDADEPGGPGAADAPDETTTTEATTTTTTEATTTTTTEPPIDPDLLLTPVGPDDSGPDVVALQQRLDELGFAPGSADGDYGRRTEAAVRIFQELAGRHPTGSADAGTMRALATYTYDGLLLRAGDEGDEVEELQLRLASGPFDPGPTDGVYGRGTVAAVWALEKLAGVPVDGDWGPVDELAWQRLIDGEIGTPEKDNEQRWVEVDLSDQLIRVYDPGQTTPVLVSHVSSGNGIPWSNEEHSGSSVTPLGDFHINRRISGWRESSLDIGRLYNPLYFNGGIAFHGATSVPLYPASHGCVRVPMHIAEYLPDELPNGTPVHVLA